MDKLIKNEDAFAKIFQLIPGAILQCQIFPDRSINFPFASDGVREIFEVNSIQLSNQGSIILKRIDKRDLKKLFSTLKISANTLTKWEHDFSVNLPIKGLRWLRGVAQPENQIDGSVIFHGYITDITERKLAARSLIQKEQRWHFAIDSSELGIWDFNFRSNTFYLSHRLLKTLGYSSGILDNTDEFWFKKIHKEDIKALKINIRRHIEGKTDLFLSENRMLCNDGSYKWILLRGKIIEWTDSKKPLRMIGTHADISDNKQKEILLEKNLKQIGEQNSRLSNFAYIVSHNLRTHTGNLEILINFIENASTQEEKDIEFSYLKSVSSQLSETIHHLNEVLSIQNASIKGIKKLNLYHFAEKAKQTLQIEIDKKEAFIYNNISKQVEIIYNPAYLESILYNLVSNSLKYSSKNRAPIVKIDCEIEDNYIVLKVTDNGIGIDLNKHNKDMFGMYKTFHGNKDAKGIGLFITKNQIESLGGKIKFESEENKGSTVSVYIKKINE